MLTKLQSIGNHGLIIAHVEKLIIDQNSLKNVTTSNGGYEGLNSKKETDIHFLSEAQAKLLHIAFLHSKEATLLLNKCSMLHPYVPVGDDKVTYDAYVESSRIAFRTMWKSIKDELTVKLPWVGENFKTLTLCRGNKVAILHSHIPAHVRENSPLTLIPEKPAYLN